MTAEQIERMMDLMVKQAVEPLPITGGLITCDGNCHKPIEQGGAMPCGCPCCALYT